MSQKNGHQPPASLKAQLCIHAGVYKLVFTLIFLHFFPAGGNISVIPNYLKFFKTKKKLEHSRGIKKFLRIFGRYIQAIFDVVLRERPNKWLQKACGMREHWHSSLKMKIRENG